MFLSSSASDFWGKRWNYLGHILLKWGFYKPIRKMTGSVGLATMSAFLGSGILHEWCSQVNFHTNVHESCSVDEYCTPVFGKQICFFGWNGILVMVEYFIIGKGLAKGPREWISKHLPRLVIGIMVVITALPVGHWFTGDFCVLNFFHHVSLAFPKVAITLQPIKAA